MERINSRALFVAMAILIVALASISSVLFFNLGNSQHQLADSPRQSSVEETETTKPASSVQHQSSEHSVDPRKVWDEVKEDVDDIHDSLIPKYKEEVEGAILVELHEDMHQWQEGDQITIVVPQSQQQFSGTIDKASTMLGNNRSFTGKIADSENSYSFLITVGERNVFANFRTSQGSFELVGNVQYAWLMPTENMDLHVDYTQDDFFIPGLEEDEHH